MFQQCKGIGTKLEPTASYRMKQNKTKPKQKQTHIDARTRQVGKQN